MRDTIPVFITQSGPRGAELVQSLHERGYRAFHSPLIETRSLVTPLPLAIRRLLGTKFDGWIFTSAVAARFWLDAIAGAEEWKVSPPVCYCIGEATATSLRDAGLVVRTYEGVSDARGLAQKIMSGLPDGAKLLFIRGQRALRALPDELRAADYSIDEAVVYDTVPAVVEPHLFSQYTCAVVVLFSPSGIDAFLHTPSLAEWARGAGIRLVPFGHTTAEALVRTGLSAAAKPSRPTHEALLNTIEDMLSSLE